MRPPTLRVVSGEANTRDAALPPIMPNLIMVQVTEIHQIGKIKDDNSILGELFCYKKLHLESSNTSSLLRDLLHIYKASMDPYTLYVHEVMIQKD